MRLMVRISSGKCSAAEDRSTPSAEHVRDILPLGLSARPNAKGVLTSSPRLPQRGYLGTGQQTSSTPTGLWKLTPNGHNPVGVVLGSECPPKVGAGAPTLGFGAERR